MLTGDLNVATVEWIVQYKIADPYKYLFKLRDVEETFRLMTEAAMRQVVGDHSVTELLTVGREAIAARAKELLSNLCKLYDNGITVQQLVLQDVDPPEPVKPSFNEVNQAIQERERAINEAWAEYNQEIPRARGRAEQQLQAAEGYAVDRVNRAKGDAQRFLALHEEYRKAPEVTRTRLHLETMSEVLPKAGQKLVLDEQRRGDCCRCSRSAGAGRGGEAMNRSNRLVAGAGGGGPAAGHGVSSALYTVSETEQVVITQFGRPIGQADHRARAAPQAALRPGRQRLRQALAGVGRRRQPGAHPRQEVHLGGHLRALAHRRSAALLPAAARRARRPVAPRRHHRRRDPQRDRQPQPHRGGAQLEPQVRAGRGGAGRAGGGGEAGRWSTGATRSPA